MGDECFNFSLLSVDWTANSFMHIFAWYIIIGYPPLLPVASPQNMMLAKFVVKLFFKPILNEILYMFRQKVYSKPEMGGVAHCTSRLVVG